MPGDGVAGAGDPPLVIAPFFDDGSCKVFLPIARRVAEGLKHAGCDQDGNMVRLESKFPPDLLRVQARGETQEGEKLFLFRAHKAKGRVLNVFMVDE